MNRIVVIAAVVAVALASPGLASQAPVPGQPVPGQPTTGQLAPGQPTPQAPARDPSAKPGEPEKGTAVLKGYVVDRSTGEPIRRAVVHANDREVGGIVSTDAEGRFEVLELPAGRYTLRAAKAGYVGMEYGQKSANEPGTPIDIREGEVVERLAFALAPGGVITGRLFDDYGDPVAEVSVSALEYRRIGGQQRLVGAGGSRSETDDQGSFRLYGLPPGEYYISATSRSGNLRFAALTNNKVETAAPTYYPGTTNVAEAQRVTVESGRETAGANFALVIARMSTIRGRAMDSAGRPASRAMAMLIPMGGNLSPSVFMSTANMVRPDGTFEIGNVPPGRYELTVRPPGLNGQGAESGSLQLSVGNDDVDGLLIVTSPGATARGRFVTDEGIPPPMPPGELRLSFSNLEPGPITFGANPEIRDDYSFEASGLSGKRLPRASVTRSGEWGVRQVLLDGVDVSDSGVEFTGSREIEGFEIVLSRRRTEISGTLTDERGQPVLDATVLVFPDDPGGWGQGSRYFGVSRPDQGGRFVVAGLPPRHDYLIVALRGVDLGDIRSPSFLETIRGSALDFTLADGEKKVQNLTVRER